MQVILIIFPNSKKSTLDRQKNTAKVVKRPFAVFFIELGSPSKVHSYCRANEVPNKDPDERTNADAQR